MSHLARLIVGEEPPKKRQSPWPWVVLSVAAVAGVLAAVASIGGWAQSTAAQKEDVLGNRAAINEVAELQECVIALLLVPPEDRASLTDAQIRQVCPAVQQVDIPSTIPPPSAVTTTTTLPRITFTPRSEPPRTAPATSAPATTSTTAATTTTQPTTTTTTCRVTVPGGCLVP